MATPLNIGDKAFATPLEVDKVYDQIFTGSFSVGASAFPGSLGNIATSSITNPYGEDVLTVMQFSTDNSNWYDAGSVIYNPGGTLVKDFTGTVYTTSGNIVVIGHNFTGSTVTCYYRLVLMAED